MGEARAEVTRGVAGGSELLPRPGRGRRRAGGVEAVAAVAAAGGAEAVAAVAVAGGAEAMAAMAAAARSSTSQLVFTPRTRRGRSSGGVDDDQASRRHMVPLSDLDSTQYAQTSTPLARACSVSHMGSCKV